MSTVSNRDEYCDEYTLTRLLTQKIAVSIVSLFIVLKRMSIKTKVEAKERVHEKIFANCHRKNARDAHAPASQV